MSPQLVYAVQVKDPKPKNEQPKAKRRVYKQMKFGEGLRSGTVEWKMLQNQEQVAERDWKKQVPRPEQDRRQPETIVSHPLLRPWQVFAG